MNTVIQFPQISITTKDQAKLYYFAGWREVDIARFLGLAQSTINTWKKVERWDEADLFERCKNSVETKYHFLINKPNKSNSDFKELDFLGRQLKDIYLPKPERNKRSAKISSDQFDWDKFTQQINEGLNDLFPYQKELIQQIDRLSNNKKSSNETLLGKSRQAGFTHTLAFYSLMRLVNLQHTQVYISASKNQAFQAKTFVQKFIKDLTNIEIGGKEKIIFKPQLEFVFLGANPSTAQGYTGDVRCDEFLWMPRFNELTTAVSACATHKKFNITYSSSASSKNHPGYEFWAGMDWNNKKGNKTFEVDHKNLKKGRLCEDGKFRKIITIHDAIEGGLDLVDLDRLHLRYTDEQFSQLFEFKFMDEISSAFNFDEITACMVDSWDEWSDFNPLELSHRPYGNNPVAIGYDPARTHDGSACIVVAVPTHNNPKWRILEKHIWHGIDFEDQTNRIKELCKQYHVVHLGIDTNAIGLPIAERVENFYPNITKYHSSPELKTLFILQAQNFFRKKQVALEGPIFQNGNNSILDMKKAHIYASFRVF